MNDSSRLYICIAAIIIAIALALLLIVRVYHICSKHNQPEQRLIESLERAGFDVRDGDTNTIIAKGSTLSGGSTNRITSYKTVPIINTLTGGSFEDIINDVYNHDTEEYSVNEPPVTEPAHIDTLSNYRLSNQNQITSNAKPLSPDEYVLNQARPLTHLDIKHLHTTDYVWLEKTDGVREMYKQNDSILDCEKYNDKLYCFDALVVKGVDVRNRSYEERMDAVKHANLPDIIVKSYQPVESIDELISFIQKNFKSPTTGHNIDGIILQERKKSYNSARVYKLKLPIMNTIDFRLKHIKDSDFVLYSGGKFINNSALQFNYPNIENCSLFVAPYYANAHRFTVKSLPEKNEYPPEIAKEITELTKQIAADPASFDGKIVELSWDGTQYYPIRIRTDKDYPNGYRTAISNIGLVYAPITIENKYFENDKSNPFSEETIGRFHENSHQVRKTIMNHLPELPKEVKRGSCLDLSCGRGGDLKALMDKGYRNLFCVDLDRIALTQLVNSLYTGDYYRHTWVNVFDYDLSGEMDTLYNRITERKDYSPGHCFQAVFMNFAIHYVIMNVAEIGKFVKRIIKPGGFFAFTFFDGDKILADNGLTERAEAARFEDNGIARPVTNNAIDDNGSVDDTDEPDNLTSESLIDVDYPDQYDSTVSGGAKRKRKTGKTKGGALHTTVTNTNRKRSSAKLGEMNLPEETIIEPEQTYTHMNPAKQYGEFTIEPFKKGDRWYGRFPLPTIASSGYREEPLVLRKELECLGSNFTEYTDLSNDEYFGLLRLRVYKY
jgi:SAM-dependent methyltransferase